MGIRSRLHKPLGVDTGITGIYMRAVSKYYQDCFKLHKRFMYKCM